MMNRVGDKVSQDKGPSKNLTWLFDMFWSKIIAQVNLSKDTHTVIRYVLKMCAIICEIIIFILLGITSVQEFMSDFLHHWARSKLLSPWGHMRSHMGSSEGIFGACLEHRTFSLYTFLYDSIQIYVRLWTNMDNQSFSKSSYSLQWSIYYVIIRT